MNSTIDDFLNEHDSFALTVGSYAGAYSDGITADQSRRAQDRQELMEMLSQVEQAHSQRLLEIDGTVASQLGRLGNIDQSISEQESQVSQRNLERAKRRLADSAHAGSRVPRVMPEVVPNDSGQRVNAGDTVEIRRPRASRSEDVQAKTIETMSAISDITESRIPKLITRFMDYIETPGRKRKYDRIAEAHKGLDKAIMDRLSDLEAGRTSERQAAVAETLAQLDAIQHRSEELDAQRDGEKASYMSALRNLLLDGMEEAFSPDSIYAMATSDLAGYLGAYTDSMPGDSTPWKRGLLLGIVNQPISAADDGTLDTYLSSVLPDGTYANGTVLLPVVLSRHLGKPLCVTYFSEYVDGVYALFANYATQLMNLYGDETLSVYMVDSAHAGGKYAGFNACADIDENKRINIVRTKEEIHSVLSDLHEHVIESNSLYLKDAYASVEEYNQSAVMKREIKAVFVSALSELGNDDLETLTTIARTGCRCGVLVFVGISSDEFQASGVITRARATATNALASLCDRIYMDSNGALGFGNGRPALVAPPELSVTKANEIMRRAVTGQGKSTVLPLEAYLPTGYDILSGSCKDRLDIPVGQTPQGTEYVISFHKDASYMLLGGNPSAGKSSLIHTMILQCVTRYRPEDLEIYIADLKDGSEFDAYAVAGVKSIRAVLDDSENDLATSFLQFIKNEISDRLQRFARLKEVTGHRIPNIEEFYEINERNGFPCENIPRLLLIVDEFQSLYSNNRQTGELTNWILRMGRTVGVAVVFSSQRSQADVNTATSSFGSQTKEYFIYRAMMKLPYSGAKDIMSDRCADTGRENPALRKAQTLKVGQAIVNSNMGATEEDTQIIQCYYPSSDVIDAICDALVASQGARDDAFILGSDKPVRRPRPASERIMLGESNRFHADGAMTDDEFHDDMLVSLDAGIGAMGVYGVNEQAFSSAAQACLSALARNHGRVSAVVLGRGRIADGIVSSLPGAIVAESPDDLIATAEGIVSQGGFALAVVAEPYLWPELSQSNLGRNGAKVEDLLGLVSDERAFVLVCAPDIKRMKTQAGWHDDAVPIRILSVGNPALLRQMVSTDVAEKIREGSFNVARADIIKAYYYNKTTGKFGRMRMFPVTSAQVDLGAIPAPEPVGHGDDDDVPAGDTGGWAGLSGN